MITELELAQVLCEWDVSDGMKREGVCRCARANMLPEFWCSSCVGIARVLLSKFKIEKK